MAVCVCVWGGICVQYMRLHVWMSTPVHECGVETSAGHLVSSSVISTIIVLRQALSLNQKLAF